MQLILDGIARIQLSEISCNQNTSYKRFRRKSKQIIQLRASE